MAQINPYNNDSLSAANFSQTGSTNPLVSDAENKGITGTVGAPSSTPVFDVNNLTSAAQNYAAMNILANQLFGYDFKWFRAIPQQRSKDVIFQEYTLYNVEECPLDIKAVVPNGQFPDSKYNYDLMGLEYEIPLELHIDKKYWESIAGFGTAPQKKDIVYMPLANKLYQVESTYLFRGFMEQETTWKVNLRKYMPEASRREKDALKETIDIYTVSSEEIFGNAVDKDIAKLVDDKQMNAFNGTIKDLYKSVDSKLEIVTQNINVYGTTVAQSYYDLMTPAWYDAITYNAQDVINITSDRAITAWVYPRTIPSIHKEYNISAIEPIVSSLDPSLMYQYDASLFSAANYIITPTPSSILLSSVGLSQTVVISRPGALNFYGKVVAISTNPLKYYVAINPFVLEDLNEIRSDWNILTGYKMVAKEPISVVDGVNDFGDHVLSINVYANQYIAISYGHTYIDAIDKYSAYVVRLPDKLIDNQWYGIVANVGNSWKQYSAYVWEKHPTDKDAKLQNIFYETLRLYPEEIAVNKYTVNKSPAYLTNLRIFNTTIEEEKQSNELLSYFSKDGDQLIIGDNADPQLLLPYITKQR